jgi:hypothetical protein
MINNHGNHGAPINTNLPDPPKARDWIRHLAGLLPFAIALAIVIVASVILPKWLKKGGADDLRGVPEQTSIGVVTQELDNPGHFGGGSVFNAVALQFAGHQVFWDLPPTSAWKPMIGEMVEVHYRVGRTGSHVVHIDSVQWGTAMDPKYRKP